MLAAAVLAGCKDKPREISKAARAEAAQLAAEASFATQIREHARAEGLLARSVELNPEVAEYWLQLGFARRRQGNLDGARDAYKEALALRQAEYKRNKAAEDLLGQIGIQVLLGKVDAARKLLERAQRDHGDDFEVRKFIEQKRLEAMLADPKLQALAL